MCFIEWKQKSLWEFHMLLFYFDILGGNVCSPITNAVPFFAICVSTLWGKEMHLPLKTFHPFWQTMLLSSWILSYCFFVGLLQPAEGGTLLELNNSFQYFRRLDFCFGRAIFKGFPENGYMLIMKMKDLIIGVKKDTLIFTTQAE